jgi:hypothetical protein
VAKAKSNSAEKSPSKMSMVETALDDLGMDAQPLELQGHIKSKFGVELPTQVISNYKFQIRKKAGQTGPGRGRRGGGGGLRVEDFEVIRGLVDRLGVAQVKKMIDVVS